MAGRAGFRLLVALAVVATPALAKNPPASSKNNLSPQAFAEAAASADFDPHAPKPVGQSPFVFRLQVLLARAHASPGVIDGNHGDNVRKAVAAFQEMVGLPVDGELNAQTWTALAPGGSAPPLTLYTLTKKDVRGPFTKRIPTDYGKMARLKRLGYRNAAEALAERFHMDLHVLHQLNPRTTFTHAGTEVLVAAIGPPATKPVERVVADKARRQVRGYGADGTLVVAYPATIGSTELPSPSGTHAVNAIAVNAEYWYRPDVNFKQGRNDKPLRLPPGPNNPIGSVWIDLTEPTYGIHGTPDPSRIDKTSSHGCVRLTNWDALELAKLVHKGVPVEFSE
jgi:lipoprotein-anchoring transpeptidase ErfK/SrfK